MSKPRRSGRGRQGRTIPVAKDLPMTRRLTTLLAAALGAALLAPAPLHAAGQGDQSVQRRLKAQ